MAESDEQAIYKKAVEKWGIDSQMAMMVEECAELILAIQHLYRFKRPETYQDRLERVIEECVDVDLMIEELKIITQHPHLWDQMKFQKLERLRKLLDQK